MAVPPFPSQFTLGSGDFQDTFDIRPKELLLAFADSLSDLQIQAILAGAGLVEHEASDPAERDVVERVRSGSMRWVDVPAGQEDRDTARTLLDQVPECWLSSPVYVPASNPHASNASAPIPGTLIVKPSSPGDESVQAEVTMLGFELDQAWTEVMKTLMRFHRVGGPSDDGFELLDLVIALPGVASAHLDWFKLDPLELTPASKFYAKQWGVQQIGMPTAWNKTKGDPSIIIAVIDLGFDLPHPGIAASFTDPALRLWVTDDPNDPNDPSTFKPDPQVEMVPTTGILTTNDTKWHGTAVAGVIAGSHAAASGVAGIAPKCGLMPIRAWPPSTSNVAAGLVWAADNGARVANFSISVTIMNDDVKEAVDYAFGTKHMVICASSGNGVPGMATNAPVEYPARYTGVIAVGACLQSGLVKRLTPGGERWFSQGGTQVSVLAPGILIPTTDARGAAGYNQGGPARSVTWFTREYAGAEAGPSGGNYIFVFTGTSAAVAHVSAIAGLILSRKPALTNHQVRDILEKTCDKPVATGQPSPYKYPYPNGLRSMVFGYGRVNAAKAVK